MNKTDIFNTIKESPVAQKKKKIIELCTGKKVLDVGCAGQDYSFNSPEWLHKTLREICSEVDGTDIDREAVKVLNDRGYSVFLTEELETKDKKYDIILIADVIEHVDNPVSLLLFYSKFLEDNGLIVITTPNAHGIRNFTNILIRNDYSVNMQHTMWLCPKTMTEVMERAKLHFAGFFWLKEYYRISEIRGIKYKCIYLINKCFEGLRRRFHPNFMYLIRK